MVLLIPTRAFDVALGVSLVLAAVLGPVRHGPSVVAFTVAAVNALVGALFLLRRPPLRSARLRETLPCFVAAAVGGVALELSPEPARWPVAASLAFAAGGALALAGLASLGRSFGVLPAVRGVERRGAYRLLRHPTYAGELAMVLAACAAAGGGGSLALGAVAVALTVARIGIEERLLAGATEAYVAYRSRVRYRLVPGVW